MKKFEKILVASAVIGMVGFSFAIATLKGLPEVFDWEEDEDDS
jgi:hypothetical protein